MIGKPAVDSLILALKDKNWWVRTRSAWALGEIKDTRWSAADALGKIGDKKALEPLTRLKDDDDDYVRRAVNDAIEKNLANNSDIAA
jgi:HEAT repeat protein